MNRNFLLKGCLAGILGLATQLVIAQTFDNEKGKRNQDGAAPSGIQTGENPLPNYRYGYCMSDSSKYCTTCWYAYAW